MEYSPDGQLLYYTTINNLHKGIWQAQIGNSDILHSSNYQVKDGTALSGFYGALQLGPDDKIYINRALELGLSTITFPNLPGSACDFQDIVYDKNGNEIIFQNEQPFSLPYFVRRDDSCDNSAPPVCRKIFGVCWPPQVSMIRYRLDQMLDFGTK